MSSIFFFLMIRRPSSPNRTYTLFPSPTLFRSPPCLPEDQRGDHEADDGIDPAEPGLPDHEPGDHHPGRYRRVRDHVEVRPADVEVALAPAREPPRGGAVDDDPDAGDDPYGHPRHVGRTAHALDPPPPPRAA